MNVDSEHLFEAKLFGFFFFAIIIFPKYASYQNGVPSECVKMYAEWIVLFNVLCMILSKKYLKNKLKLMICLFDMVKPVRKMQTCMYHLKPYSKNPETNSGTIHND